MFSVRGSGGSGGFGGGGGATYGGSASARNGGFVGASAGLGGAVFVVAGGTVRIAGTTSLDGTAAGGTSSQGQASGFGGGIFYQGRSNGTVSTLAFGDGDQTITGGIADYIGSGGTNPGGGGNAADQGGRLALDKNGTGTLTLKGANTYTGGTAIHAGTLDLAAYGAAGSGAITFASGPQMLLIEAAALGTDALHSFANLLSGFGTDGDVIDVAGVGLDAASYDADSGTLTLADGTGAAQATLHITGNYAGLAFKSASDGAGGTRVTLAQDVLRVTGALARDTGASGGDGVTSDATVAGRSSPGALITLTDEAGLAGQTTVTTSVALTLLTQAPGAAAAPRLTHDTGGAAGGGITRDPAILFAAPAAGDALIYSVDGGAYASAVPAFATDGTADGRHTVSVEQVDLAGNAGAPSSLAFTLDTTAPAVTAAAPATVEATAAAGAAVLFTGAAADAADGADPVSYVEQLAGGATRAVKSGDTFGIGTHTVAASATDRAGNTGASAPFTACAACGSSVTSPACWRA